MSTVIVLAGGHSKERSISLRSGAAVATQLERNRHEVVVIDPADGLEKYKSVITNAGAVFPALHGFGGEDGSLQKTLEEWKVPFVGSGSTASALCFDKQRLLVVAAKEGILVPRGGLVTKKQFAASPLIGKPFVLKPVNGVSSIDSFIVHVPNQFAIEQTDMAFERHGTMLLEEFITGTEITAGILGDTPLPIVEVIPSTTGVFEYESRYNGANQEFCPPKNVRKPQQRAAQELALRLHKLAGCRDLSRSDFIINNQGDIYLLETNTLPGLTEQSRFPKAAYAAGLAPNVLMERLVQFALGRGR